MTEQIIIKLNKKKFKPLLDQMNSHGENTSLTYSECVGKCLFFLNIYFSEKIDLLDGKTRNQFILDKMNSSKENVLLDFIKKYGEFLKSN